MATTRKPYKPESGTVPARVLEHILKSPDLREMSSREISNIFAIPITNVSGTLKSLVTHDLLRVRRDGRQCFYRAAPSQTGRPDALVTAGQAQASAPAPTAHGLTAALYNDGELYLHGFAPMQDGGVLLSAQQTAELRAYLLHTGNVSAIASANGGSLT